MSVRVRSLGIESAGRMRFFEWTEDAPPDGGFVAETLYSGVSSGTELSFFKGTNPYLHSSWNDDMCVFCEGTPARSYPITSLGYMEVARVEQTRTERVRAGDVVAMAYGHRSRYVAAPGDFFAPLPGDLDPVLGVYVAQMGPICANGVLHAASEFEGRNVRSLGDGVRDRVVVVTGAGVVGLLTAAFARHNGARDVVVVDRSQRRLEVAEKLGFDVLDESHDDAWRTIKDRWRHGARDRGADVVFQCRGNAENLAIALRLLRPQGTAIDLAFYGGGAEALRLGEEFHHNGLAIRCAQIGRVPRGTAHLWDRERLSAETVRLLRAEGRGVLEHVITDLVPLDQAPALLADLADHRRHVLQAVFTFGDR